MWGDECKFPVAVILDDMIFEGPWKPDVPHEGYKIAINKPAVMQLELWIEQSEYLPAHEHIIPIDNHEYLIRFAIFHGSLPEIMHGLVLHLIVVYINVELYAHVLVILLD